MLASKDEDLHEFPQMDRPLPLGSGDQFPHGRDRLLQVTPALEQPHSSTRHHQSRVILLRLYQYLQGGGVETGHLEQLRKETPLTQRLGCFQIRKKILGVQLAGYHHANPERTVQRTG